MATIQNNKIVFHDIRIGETIFDETTRKYIFVKSAEDLQENLRVFAETHELPSEVIKELIRLSIVTEQYIKKHFPTACKGITSGMF